jgi:hypothetical protein
MSLHDGYLSTLVGRAAVIAGSEPQPPIGNVVDFLVTKPDDTFPRIDGLVETRGGERYVPLTDVVAVDEVGSIVLRSSPDAPVGPEGHAVHPTRHTVAAGR